MPELGLGDCSNHLLAFEEVGGDVLVLVGYADDQVALVSQADVGSAHVSGCLVTRVLDIDQVVVHLV